ncbi:MULTISPECIES: family 2B encapsulin nanocompartment shell protein [unclassified Aureimonas]|uniref:family 2B encapsulin nanocompartment shell protein n=1 Tax=unclassified Aureimonas TaxID=2615206 RepID=UPI0007000BED|nr:MULTISPECIES: family 2B encapsulin nanocompartment shell protein [unclassified Aureimonas]KQT60620.1 cyclic nucleotide-binding protein [Aureimonas sp. Leaf427]KQT79492.1 cyclic nucleotide-binding protein [Aureimonas sp. Leaf460]
MVASSPALPRLSVSAETARNLSTATVTPIQNAESTPRWLHKLLPWVEVAGGVYRVNRRLAFPINVRHVELSGEGEKVSVRPDSLKGLAAFSALDDALLAQVADGFESRKLKSGEALSGKDGDGLIVVASGTVALTADGPHGTRLRKGLIGQGGFFGEDVLSGKASGRPTISPLTDVTLLILSSAAIDGIAGLRDSIANSIAAHTSRLEGVNDYGETRVALLAGHSGEPQLPTTFVDFAENSREYHLSTIQTVLQTHTRITDLYSNELDQLREQVRVTIEVVKEREEWELLNNPDFGLLHEVVPSQRVPTRSGPPTPDDLDELLTKVWKKPAFFIAHPLAIAAFGREATRRGVPPVVVHLFGSPFITWRGVPLVPSNKIPITGGADGTPATTSILLLRVGQDEQGVVGLQKAGVTGEVEPGLSVRYMGTNEHSISSHLVTRYFSTAVLIDDAIARLDNVLIERYHDYSA